MDENKKNVKLDEWVEETREVELQVPTFEVTDDKRLRFAGTTPIKKTIKEKAIYTPLIQQAICAENDHYYNFLNGGRRDADGRLLVRCTKCPIGRNFVLGVHELRDGRIYQKVNE